MNNGTNIISKPIINRLVLSKYLFLQGKNELARKSKLSANLALLNFHDSFEMLIVAIAYHLGINVTKEKRLPKLIEEIDAKQSIHTEGFGDINNARIRLKHYGEMIEYLTVEEYGVFMERNFRTNIENIFGIPFDKLRLSSLVEDKETKDHLHSAEIAIEGNDVEKYLIELSIAFSYVVERMEESNFQAFGLFGERFFRKQGPRLADPNASAINYTNEMLNEIEHRFEILEEFLTFSSYNINTRDYLVFKSLTPYISVSLDGTRRTTFTNMQRYQNEWNLTKNNLEFLLNFVIDCSLKVDNISPSLIPRDKVPRRKIIVVSEKAKIYVTSMNMNDVLLETQKDERYEEGFPVELDFKNEWISIQLKEPIIKNNIKQFFGYMLKSDIVFEE